MAVSRAKRGGGRGFPKRKPTTSAYAVVVVDDAELAAARGDLESAQALAVLAASTDAAVRDRWAEMIAAARARWAECFEWITFTEIDPGPRDALLTAHPFPEDIDSAPAGWQWSYVHHLAAASSDVDRTPAEWAEWTAGWSEANWNELRDAVMAAQTRTVTAGLPKG